MNGTLLETLSKDEILLLHLGDEGAFDEMEEPVSLISKENILSVLDEEEEEINDLLDGLKKEGKVSESTEEEETYYHLTEKGEEHREKLWDEIKNEEIILIDDKDTIELKLKNIRKVLAREYIVKIIGKTDENNKLDIREDSKLTAELVGRDEQIKDIRDSLEEIKDDSGKAIFIAGDTGIGKTRLVEELKRWAVEEDFDFLKGKCHLEDYEPYHPFKNALRKFLTIEREIGEFESVISPSQSSDGKAQTKQMFDAQRKSVFYGTTKFLESLCEFKPLVLFLDDLQWADKGTLNLLDYMTGRLKDKPVLILGTYRPGDVSEDDPLKETMRRMSRKRLYEKIELSPLETESIEDLIKSLTNVEEVPESFVESMEEKTNGNPLFIIENLNQMIEEKLIDPVEGSFPDESEIVLIPEVVQNVIEKRVYKLDDKTREILQLGSVIGKKIPFDLIVEASEADELEILERIDDLLENKIWREHPRDESFVFSHDFFVDTIYEGIGKWLEKKALHRKVAGAMEKVYENELVDKYSTLGRHYRKGEEYRKSFEYFKKAGEKAERVYSHEDAIERYKEGLKAATKIESLDEEEFFVLLEKLGEATSIIGNYEECRKYFNQALTKTEDIEKQRRMYRKIAKSWTNQGEFKKVISIAEEGLNLVNSDEMLPEEELEESEKEKSPGELDDSPEICNLLSQKGWALRRIGKSDEAKEIFFEELEKAKEINDSSSLSQAYHDLGSLERSVLDREKCKEYLLKSIEIRKEILDEKDSFEDKYGLSRSYNNLGAIYIQYGDQDKALEYFEKALELHQEIKNKLFEARTLSNMAVISMKKGELDRAERILDDVFEIEKAIGDKQGMVRAENNRGQLYLERGKFDLALDQFESSLELSEEIDDKYGTGLEYISFSKGYMFKGEIEKAEKYAEKAYELGKKIKSNRMKADALIQDGALKRLNGDLEKALDLHNEGQEVAEETTEVTSLFQARCELIEDYIEKNDLENARQVLQKAKEEKPDVPDLDNKIEMVEGILQRERGSLEEAEETLQQCLEGAEDLSKKYRIARVYYELGKVYEAKDQKTKAKEYLNEAEKRSKEMGMELILQRSRDELEKVS